MLATRFPAAEAIEVTDVSGGFFNFQCIYILPRWLWLHVPDIYQVQGIFWHVDFGKTSISKRGLGFYTNVYTIPFADVKAGNQVDAWAHNCGRGLESRNSTPLLSSPIISTSSLSLCLLRMLS